MRRLITEKFAIGGLITLLTMLVVVHVLILLRVIPYEMVWGGRLQDVSEMRRFEAVSIVVTLLMLVVVAVRGRFLNIKINPMILHAALWAMFGLFLLNTLGNLLSNHFFEKWVFAPTTSILSLFCLRLASTKIRD